MKLFAFLFLILSTTTVPAESIYPKDVPIRLFGMAQGYVGSCMAESEVTALEHAFAAHNFPIMLSTFHRHAYNWRTNGNVMITPNQFYAPGDKDSLTASGEFVPNYYWPEDALGYDSFERKRPSFTQASTWRPGSPVLPISGVPFTFHRPVGGGSWVNLPIMDFEGIKNQVRAGNPITISLHGMVMTHFDPGTGFLLEPYRQDWLPSDKQKYVEENNHSVAVVGFDDDLYADHGYPQGGGAFIIRNSWNDKDEVNATTYTMRSPSLRPELESFRLKIAKDNLPGYYALPYQYVRDVINYPNPQEGVASGVGGGKIFNVDYNEAYRIYSAGYQERLIYTVPFACDRAIFEALSKEFAEQIKVKSPPSKQGLFEFLFRFLNPYTSALKLARLSVANSDGLDRVKDFASGTFAEYYCGTTDKTPQFPNSEDLKDPRFLEILELFRAGESSLTTWYRLFSWANCKQTGEMCL